MKPKINWWSYELNTQLWKKLFSLRTCTMLVTLSILTNKINIETYFHCVFFHCVLFHCVFFIMFFHCVFFIVFFSLGFFIGFFSLGFFIVFFRQFYLFSLYRSNYLNFSLVWSIFHNIFLVIVLLDTNWLSTNCSL